MWSQGVFTGFRDEEEEGGRDRIGIWVGKRYF